MERYTEVYGTLHRGLRNITPRFTEHHTEVIGTSHRGYWNIAPRLLEHHTEVIGTSHRGIGSYSPLFNAKLDLCKQELNKNINKIYHLNSSIKIFYIFFIL